MHILPFVVAILLYFMYMNKKIIATSVLALSLLFGGVGVFALTEQAVPTLLQVTSVAAAATAGDVDTQQTSTCLDLKSDNLRYRTNDASTNNEVSDIQDFLIAKSLLKTEATGYFGLGTFAAVKQFQKMSGLNPTGYVGPLTKAKIKEQSCTMTTSASATLTPAGNLGDDVIFKYGRFHVATGTIKMCTMEARLCADGAMMARDMNTCEWITSSCLGTSTIPKKIIDTQNCTQQVKFCPNGTVMPQAGCTFYPEKCSSLPGTAAGVNLGDDAISINPSNTFNPKATSTRPIACTMEARLCPDGRMMSRNLTNCEWLTSSCASAAKIISPRVGDPSYYPPVATSTVSPKKIIDQVYCTMQVKLCPNGSPMYRDDMCGWHPEKCTGGNGTDGMSCVRDSFTGQVSCGSGGAMPTSY